MKTWKLILLVLVLVGGTYYASNKVHINEGKNTTVEVKTTKSEIEKIMDEESFKKATILRARKVANDKKKDAEIQRNKEIMANIEKEYEAIRADELTLVGSADVSLK